MDIFLVEHLKIVSLIIFVIGTSAYVLISKRELSHRLALGAVFSISTILVFNLILTFVTTTNAYDFEPIKSIEVNNETNLEKVKTASGTYYIHNVESTPYYDEQQIYYLRVPKDEKYKKYLDNWKLYGQTGLELSITVMDSNNKFGTKKVQKYKFNTESVKTN